MTSYWQSQDTFNPPSLVSICTFLLLLAGCGSEPSTVAEMPRPIAWVEIVSAEAGAIRTVPAVIQSKDRAELAFQVPGRVGVVNVSVGDSVEDNAVLASLDDETFRLTLKQRQAELAQANAGLVEAQAEFQRDAELIKDGAISQTQFERSRARRDTAKGSVELLTAAVGLDQENLEYTKLRAPYAGEITTRRIEPAQQVQVGQTVLGIQIESVLEASLTVPEDWINRLTQGSKHALTLRSLPGVDLMGRITEIGRDAQANNAYPVTLELDSPPDTVRSGMSAEVKLSGAISTVDTDSVLIPLTAFISGPNQETYAFVIDVDSSVVLRRTVTLGEIVEQGITVLDGLSPGERIASKGLAYLANEQPVTLLGSGPERFLQ